VARDDDDDDENIVQPQKLQKAVKLIFNNIQILMEVLNMLNN
jgi:hypothetical protein